MKPPDVLVGFEAKKEDLTRVNLLNLLEYALKSNDYYLILRASDRLYELHNPIGYRSKAREF